MRRCAGAAWLGALLLGCHACLVTEKFDYEERNVRSHIQIISPASFTRVVQTDDPECATTGGMFFLALVSDPDQDDELEARVLINGVDDHASSGSISRAGTPNAQLEVPLCIKQTRLVTECNRVELLVSRGFLDGVDRYATKEDDDLAKVEWWVLGASSDVPGARPYDCASLLGDAGVP